tara:strand:- start:1637 stop:2893 length:1257 start_codon:yes stop_codon:yes gene_type:complete
MEHLAVYLNTNKVGILQPYKGSFFKFRYNDDWIRNANAVPLSRSLPLQADFFTVKKSRAFFSGILPEGIQRERIEKILKISNNNDYQLLKKIGGDCAGAVSIYPNNVIPSDSSQGMVNPLTKKELIKVINELPTKPLLAGKKGLRLSLAGAQTKIPVILQNNKICLPYNDLPSTHILKPEPSHFKGLAINEVFCMKLAKNSGLNVPGVEYRIIGDKPTILIQRYDRIKKTDRITRIHQEDFCQALGIPPERKYQAEGGPTINQCITLLRDWSSVPALDIINFMNAVIFNVIIGNTDAHGKNFSFLYAGKNRSLAPNYDLVSTLAWPELSTELAMTIGSSKSINVFGIGEWKKMTLRNTLGWPMVRKRIELLALTVVKESETVQINPNGDDDEITEILKDVINSRARKLLDALAHQNVV